VPVFRYALERWPSDTHRVLVFHKGKLAEADQAVVDWLKKVGTREDGPSPLDVEAVDLAGKPDEAMRELWKAQGDPELPWMVVLYPVSSGIPVPAWAGRLTADAAKRLVDSPARQEIARRILDGESAVWLLVECGQQDKDDAAAKLLEGQLKEQQEGLKLPAQDALTAQDDAGKEGAAPPDTVEILGGPPAPAAPELRVAFALLRVKRTDPAEVPFVSTLLHLGKDLPEVTEPMAFPVYGRGRVLPPFVGAEINADNLGDACAFLVGPCACQIKAQAPGTDLLMLTDWDAALEGTAVKEELPPLLGVPDTTTPSAERAPVPPRLTSEEPVSARGEGTGLAPSPLVRNIAIAVGAALVVLGIATLVVLRKSRTLGD
jgi:hypothetical protein